MNEFYSTALDQLRRGKIVIESDGSIWRVGTKLGSIEPRRLDVVGGLGYAVFTIRSGSKTSSLAVHKFVYMSVHGDVPDGFVIDHRNGNRLDNRPCNLEAVSSSENAKRRHHYGAKEPKQPDGVFKSNQLGLFLGAQ